MAKKAKITVKTPSIKKSTKKKLTIGEKYYQLAKQTKQAGMTIKEVNRKLVVSRKKK